MRLQKEFRGSYYQTTAPMRPIDELLSMQSKGKFLALDEKERVQKYAEQKRKQRLNKN